jgi:hypothetical protein
MTTILTLLLIHWILGVVFAIGVIIYGYNQGNDVLIFFVGRPLFFFMLFLGWLLAIPSIINFFYQIKQIKNENKKFLEELLNIPHREEIDHEWNKIVNKEWYNSARYNVKEGGWLDSLVFPQNINKDELEHELRYHNKVHKSDYYRPKSLSHLTYTKP